MKKDSSKMSPNTNLVAKPKSKEEHMGALQLLAHTRSKLREHLGLSTHGERESADDDLERCISEIQALILVNDEIFARCMVNSRVEVGDKTTLERFGFEAIELRIKVNTIKVVTHAERTQKLFDTSSLSKLPACLADTILVKFKPTPFCAYIDYDDYFRRAMMLLHEDALRLLLPKLKGHLESVQVCLGEIDEWVMQSHKIVSIANQIREQKAYYIPGNIYPFQDRQRCLSCNWGIHAASRCTTQTCGKTRLLAKFENTSLDMSREDDHDRLLKFISFMRGN